jgi:uncharacterized protein (DUF1800 family)
MQVDIAQSNSVVSTSGSERLLGASASALALAACGGGGGASPSTSTAGGGTIAQAPVSTNALPDAASASRLINQAAFGGNRATLDAMTQKGASAWLTEQMDMPRSQSMSDWLIAKGFSDATVNGNINGDGGWPNAIWWKMFAAPDAVRQRAALALSEIFVVSALGLGAVTWKNFALANYWDILEKNAFGNFRTLLDAITLSSAMGSYLNMKGNQKADPALGRLPDENYAREVMQLFTIGLYRLQSDGSLALDASGNPQETYDNTDIQGLAKVFTGWNASAANDPSGVLVQAAYRNVVPMALTGALHSTEEKRFLGQVIPASTTVDGAGDLKIALDALFNHPNTAPFISKQLIQRLVTSNPSGAYVARVAAVFSNNGAGVRGDLRAVFQAIWLDAEARAPGALPAFGKLREPVLRIVQWGRTFGATNTDGLWNLGYTDADTALGQMPLRAPSVFNFFRPGYVPSNSALGAQNMVAPEFQITAEPTVVGYINYLAGTVNNARVIKADYTYELTLATDAAALVAWLNQSLAGGALEAATVTLITQSVATIAATTDAGKLNRVYAALTLVMASTDYLVQK